MRFPFKHRRFGTIAVVVAVLSISWIATATIGITQILNSIPHGHYKSLANDPIREDHDPLPAPPWAHLSAFSPAPFVVVVDWGVMQSETLGSGGREYYVWVLGLTMHASSQFVWNA